MTDGRHLEPIALARGFKCQNTNADMTSQTNDVVFIVTFLASAVIINNVCYQLTFKQPVFFQWQCNNYRILTSLLCITRFMKRVNVWVCNEQKRVAYPNIHEFHKSGNTQ